MTDHENEPRPAPAASKTRTIVVAAVAAAVAGVIGSVAGRNAVQQLFDGGEAAINRTLAKTASEINRTLPMMVDRNTQFHATAALPGNKLQYRYKLIDMDPVPTAKQLEESLRPSLINNYKTSPDMQDLRESGVILVYDYSDENGNHITQFEVSTDDF